MTPENKGVVILCVAWVAAVVGGSVVWWFAVMAIGVAVIWYSDRESKEE